jgi:hypothetical protein
VCTLVILLTKLLLLFYFFNLLFKLVNFVLEIVAVANQRFCRGVHLRATLFGLKGLSHPERDTAFVEGLVGLDCHSNFFADAVE